MFFSFLLLFSCLFEVDGHKYFQSKHVFPHSDEYHDHIVNEFQLLHPEFITVAPFSVPMHADSSVKLFVDNLHKNMKPSVEFYGTNKTLIYEITKVTPTSIQNNEVVTVYYSTNSPNRSDWIAAYAPASSISNLSATVPIKYGYCDESEDYYKFGNGSLTFNLTNVRSDVIFVYFSAGIYTPILHNVSTQLVTFANINQPLRPRIVPTSSTTPDNFLLLWSSYNSTSPIMRYGITPGIYTRSFVATTSTIEKSDLCGAPATTIGWFDLGLIHQANFSGMVELAGTTIYYIFGDEDTNNFSNEYTFFVPPLAGQKSNKRGTRLILYDDLGRGSTDMTYTWDHYGDPSILTTMAVGQEVVEGRVDAIYHGGDISYATGYLAVWDFFMDQVIHC